MVYKKLDLSSCRRRFFGPPPRPANARQRLGAHVVRTLNAAFCGYYRTHCPGQEALLCPPEERPPFDPAAASASGCADLHGSCWSWALDDQCATNPGFMNSTCALSCERCPPPPPSRSPRPLPPAAENPAAATAAASPPAMCEKEKPCSADARPAGAADAAASPPRDGAASIADAPPLPPPPPPPPLSIAKGHADEGPRLRRAVAEAERAPSASLTPDAAEALARLEGAGDVRRPAASDITPAAMDNLARVGGNGAPRPSLLAPLWKASANRSGRFLNAPLWSHAPADPDSRLHPALKARPRRDRGSVPRPRLPGAATVLHDEALHSDEEGRNLAAVSMLPWLLLCGGMAAAGLARDVLRKLRRSRRLKGLAGKM
mmetsp:Transcript_21359/g.68889  ORF Transcript_21359/g.68889 Transcript_21359/m.68889 type:complete len:375 (+) Transcript_21359:1096-2220(+)